MASESARRSVAAQSTLLSVSVATKPEVGKGHSSLVHAGASDSAPVTKKKPNQKQRRRLKVQQQSSGHASTVFSTRGDAAEADQAFGEWRAGGGTDADIQSGNVSAVQADQVAGAAHVTPPCSPMVVAHETPPKVCRETIYDMGEAPPACAGYFIGTPGSSTSVLSWSPYSYDGCQGSLSMGVLPPLPPFPVAQQQLLTPQQLQMHVQALGGQVLYAPGTAATCLNGVNAESSKAEQDGPWSQASFTPAAAPTITTSGLTSSISSSHLQHPTQQPPLAAHQQSAQPPPQPQLLPVHASGNSSGSGTGDALGEQAFGQLKEAAADAHTEILLAYHVLADAKGGIRALREGILGTLRRAMHRIENEVEVPLPFAANGREPEPLEIDEPQEGLLSQQIPQREDAIDLFDDDSTVHSTASAPSVLQPTPAPVPLPTSAGLLHLSQL